MSTGLGQNCIFRVAWISVCVTHNSCYLSSAIAQCYASFQCNVLFLCWFSPPCTNLSQSTIFGRVVTDLISAWIRLSRRAYSARTNRVSALACDWNTDRLRKVSVVWDSSDTVHAAHVMSSSSKLCRLLILCDRNGPVRRACYPDHVLNSWFGYLNCCQTRSCSCSIVRSHFRPVACQLLPTAELVYDIQLLFTTHYLLTRVFFTTISSFRLPLGITFINYT